MLRWELRSEAAARNTNEVSEGKALPWAPGYAVWTANSSLAFTAILPVSGRMAFCGTTLMDPSLGDKSNTYSGGSNFMAAGQGARNSGDVVSENLVANPVCVSLKDRAMYILLLASPELPTFCRFALQQRKLINTNLFST
jgi:hypothetical protein